MVEPSSQRHEYRGSMTIGVGRKLDERDEALKDLSIIVNDPKKGARHFEIMVTEYEETKKKLKEDGQEGKEYRCFCPFNIFAVNK